MALVGFGFLSHGWCSSHPSPCHSLFSCIMTSMAFYDLLPSTLHAHAIISSLVTSLVSLIAVTSLIISDINVLSFMSFMNCSFCHLL